MENHAAISFEVRSDNIGVVYFDSPARRVNTITPSVLQHLRDTLTGLNRSATLYGLIFTSRKANNFCAGADLDMLLEARLRSDGTAKIAQIGQELANLIEQLSFPTLAAIDGGCLGGGLELALACDFRLVTSQPATILGFPEAKLGLIPGWGGTQRLPRIVGLQTAIELITRGDVLGARRSVEIGLALDDVAPESLIHEAVRVLALANGQSDWLERRQRLRGPVNLDGVQTDALFASSRSSFATRPLAFTAPLAALEVMQKTVNLDLVDGLKIEADAFSELLRSEVAANLMHTFLAVRKIAGNPGTGDSTGAKSRTLENVAVIGGGLMGSGIAVWLACKGISVTLLESTEELLARAVMRVGSRLDKRIASLTSQTNATSVAAGNITPTIDLNFLKKSEFVLEAITESLEEKSRLFTALNGIVPSTTILASNTSTISISKLAQNLDRPERFVGVHFFNPVERMQLVEVIRGIMTDDETVSAAVTLAKRIGKTPIVVKDCPGFLVNRLLFPYMNEALMLIEDGVSPETIDDAAKNFGMPVGPIALYDIIGLDTALAASRVLAAAYPERMSEPKILAAQVQAGRLGQKSGVGFYRYDSARPSGKLDDDLKDITAPYRKTYRACNEEEIISRLFMPMLVEAIHALGEEIVQNVETIDVSLILGIGFPPSRGGIFRWADSVGASKILELLQTLQFLGDRFRPPGELLRLARTGKLFYSDRTAKKDNTKGNTALEG